MVNVVKVKSILVYHLRPINLQLKFLVWKKMGSFQELHSKAIPLGFECWVIAFITRSVYWIYVVPSICWGHKSSCFFFLSFLEADSFISLLFVEHRGIYGFWALCSQFEYYFQHFYESSSNNYWLTLCFFLFIYL